MLVDTDILIWYMRGNPRAAALIRDTGEISLSAVTYMELVQGMRNKRELQVLRKTVKTWGARTLPLTESISSRATVYLEEHFLSHSMGLADALIAATAVEHGLTLATANSKHYRMVEELVLNEFRP